MQLKLSCLAKFAKLGKTCCIWYTHTYVQYIIYITYVYVLYVRLCIIRIYVRMFIVHMCCECVLFACVCVCVCVKTLIRNSSLRYSYNLVHTYVQICLLCIEQTRTGVSLKYWSTVRIKSV